MWQTSRFLPLNDPLAGSVAALELMEHLETTYTSTALEHFFAELREEVGVDRQELGALMSRLQVNQSRLRQATPGLLRSSPS